MNSSSGRAERLTARQTALMAVLAALMMGLKLAMAALPNIEPVSLLVICCALVFGARSLYCVCVYVLLECLVFGVGLWSVSYLYVWPLLAFAALGLRRLRSHWVLACASAVFGLAFGALCAIPYLFIGGPAAAAAYWIAGIPYDLLHGAGNAVLAFALLRPLHALLARLAGVPLWPEEA